LRDLPNIVMVVFDTARRDRFGAYGYGRATTPTVDALAREGLRVDTMIANGPWTLPSHASLFTGLYPSQHGCQWGTGNRLRDSVPLTLAESLRALGYETICATSNGLISEETGLARGFDRYAFRMDLERGRRRIARRVRKALSGGDSGGRILNRWVRDQIRTVRKPFFLLVNYLECHWAYAPPRWCERAVGGSRYDYLEGLRYRLRFASRTGPWEAVARADERDLRVYSTLYDGELRNVDRHLADLMGFLDRANHLSRDESVVIVTSDHGEHIGEHGLADHQASLDEHLVHVPFVVWSPGRIATGNTTRLYESVDVLPSLLHLLGVERPPWLQGRRTDLFTTTDRSPGGGDGYAISEWRAWTPKEVARLSKRNPSYDFRGLDRDLLSIRDQRFKLIRADGRDRLHDLLSEDGETVDVADELPDEADRLRAGLEETIASWDGSGADPRELSPDEQREIEQRLSELGYI
jgi:arylsulfatase A-like enzyme